MILFDQLPFGPLPASRPTMVPFDPDLEPRFAARLRPSAIELVEPVPAELAGVNRDESLTHPQPVSRRLIAGLVLVTMIGGLVPFTVVLIGLEGAVALAVVSAIVVAWIARQP